MDLEQRCTIPVARAELWKFLMDVPQMAACVPGVDSVTAEGEDRYSGRMRIKFGPISLSLQGAVTIETRDQDNWRAVARAEANDRRVGGGARINADMALVETGPDATDLIIRAQARFLGKLGEFGEPIIRKQTNATLAAFARNVAARFASGSWNAPEPAAASPSETKPSRPAARPRSEPSAASPQPSAQGKPASSQPPGIPWVGKLIGLCIGLAIWLIAPTAPKSGPDWLRMLAVTIALVVLGDLVERAIRRMRATPVTSDGGGGKASPS